MKYLDNEQKSLKNLKHKLIRYKFLHPPPLERITNVKIKSRFQFQLILWEVMEFKPWLKMSEFLSMILMRYSTNGIQPCSIWFFSSSPSSSSSSFLLCEFTSRFAHSIHWICRRVAVPAACVCVYDRVQNITIMSRCSSNTCPAWVVAVTIYVFVEWVLLPIKG